MNREEVQKLLGGYATGTLTPEEQQALFAAALDDQELFDALAREQSLRDLLRDPAAKAQVLAALDTARVPWYRHGWWLPAAAVAGIAVMAVLATWKPAPPPQPVIMAELKELKTEAPAPAPGPVPVASPQREPDAPVARRAKPLTLPEGQQAASANKDLPAPPVPAAAPPPPPPKAEQPVIAESRKEAAPPPPAAVPSRFSTADSIQVEAQQMKMPMAQQQGQQGQQRQSLGQLGLRDPAASGGAALDSRLLAPNARLLFYGNPAAADAVMQLRTAKKTDAAELARAANGVKAADALSIVPAFHMGVRCSILRKQAGGETVEVGIETVLDAGERIKLKLVPNERGRLRVWEPGANGGLRSVASGSAQPLQPFEASLPDYRASGARLLYVQFTRSGEASLAPAQARADVIQTVANDAEKATYVVTRASDPALQQLVIPITLNYK